MATTVSSSEELKQRIAELELRRTRQRAGIVNSFHEVTESVKPKNLVMAGLQSISEAPVLRQNLINAAISLGTGWIARKLAVPKDDSLIKKTAGAALQYGISHLMATQGDNISDVLGKFFRNFKRHR